VFVDVQIFLSYTGACLSTFKSCAASLNLRMFNFNLTFTNFVTDALLEHILCSVRFGVSQILCTFCALYGSVYRRSCVRSVFCAVRCIADSVYILCCTRFGVSQILCAFCVLYGSVYRRFCVHSVLCTVRCVAGNFVLLTTLHRIRMP
jgi:hypothetical protein